MKEELIPNIFILPIRDSEESYLQNIEFLGEES